MYNLPKSLRECLKISNYENSTTDLDKKQYKYHFSVLAGKCLPASKFKIFLLLNKQCNQCMYYPYVKIQLTFYLAACTAYSMDCVVGHCHEKTNRRHQQLLLSVGNWKHHSRFSPGVTKRNHSSHLMQICK